MLLFLLSSLAQGTAGEPTTVRLTVAEPSGLARRNWPVTSGIPLGQGIVRDGEQAALFASDGLQIPLQTEVLSRWPDGSVRWLLLDFSIDLAARETKRLTLQCGSNVRRPPVANGVRALSRDDAVVIETGPLRVALSPKSFRLLDEVRLDRNGDGSPEPLRLTHPKGVLQLTLSLLVIDRVRKTNLSNPVGVVPGMTIRAVPRVRGNAATLGCGM